MKKEEYCRNYVERTLSNQYFALIHYPVYNKNREVVAASLTPIDVHDLARLARTYNVERFFLVTPLEGQRLLVQRIVQYWAEGPGAAYNPRRCEALARVSVAETVEEARAMLQQQWGRLPLLVATTARHWQGAVDYEQVRKQMEQNSRQPFLLLFGTGWGLTDELLGNCHFVLESINPSGSNYNHLSIRTAAAIVLDRLSR